MGTLIKKLSQLTGHKSNTSEVTQYTSDIERMTRLRNAVQGVERERYDNIIRCMQVALEVLIKR